MRSKSNNMTPNTATVARHLKIKDESPLMKNSGVRSRGSPDQPRDTPTRRVPTTFRDGLGSTAREKTSFGSLDDEAIEDEGEEVYSENDSYANVGDP